MNSSSNLPTQGGLANKQGRVLESTVIGLFHNHGFKVAPHAAWIKKPEVFGDEILVTGAPYTSIYGHKGKTEFLAISKRFNLKLRIECKWQQSSGSVDEKFPYLYLNCVQAMPEDDIVVIIDGGGAKAAAVNWLRQAARDRLLLEEKQATKNIQVFSLTEFIQWANVTLR